MITFLYVCFTVDHEIYFGQNNASEFEIVIKPTYQLLKTVEEFGIPLCLMTDVCSINRYRELGIDNSYTELMEKQLADATIRGHDVQLHIHPHWLTSEYINGSWKFDHSHYRIHSFGFNEDDYINGLNIISDGKKYLEDLLKPVDREYECIAFRAGGWCLQPEKDLLKALIAAGISIDTTIFYGGSSKKSQSHYYDFRRVPNKPNWWIDPEKGINFMAEKADNRIFEVAIGSYQAFALSAVKKIMFKMQRIAKKKEEAKGTSIESIVEVNLMQKLTSKINNIIYEPIILSFDGAYAQKMIDIIKYYLKKFNCDNHDYYISMIGHSKTLSENDFYEIKKFCNLVEDRFSNRVKFIRLRDIPIRKTTGHEDTV